MRYFINSNNTYVYEMLFEMACMIFIDFCSQEFRPDCGMEVTYARNWAPKKNGHIFPLNGK